MSEEVAFWVAARRGNSLVLMEQRGFRVPGKEVNTKTSDFSIIKNGKRIDLGKLIRVDLSLEALMEGVEIREGDKILLFPAGSGVAG